MNSIQNADIGKTVANMTQYNVLQSTGMAEWTAPQPVRQSAIGSMRFWRRGDLEGCSALWGMKRAMLYALQEGALLC